VFLPSLDFLLKRGQASPWDLSPLKKSSKKVGKKVGDHGDGILYMNSYIK